LLRRAFSIAATREQAFEDLIEPACDTLIIEFIANFQEFGNSLDFRGIGHSQKGVEPGDNVVKHLAPYLARHYSTSAVIPRLCFALRRSIEAMSFAESCCA
jgi:hypothetical protein